MFHVVTKCWRHKLATTAVSRASEKAIYFRQTSIAKPAGRRTQASEQSELITKQVLLAMKKKETMSKDRMITLTDLPNIVPCPRSKIQDPAEIAHRMM